MKKTLSIFISIILTFCILTGCTSEQIGTIIESTTASVSTTISESSENDTPVTLSSDVINMAEDTIEAIEQNEDIASNELAPIPSDESAIEPDAQVEQEDISYDGTNTGKGTSLLGPCMGLTYYSQADSRWANKPYTSIGSSSQTMSLSACGPTSAAMVVSSSKGAILPTTMAKLSVDNRFRTDNNGTAWAYFRFVADFFNFRFYDETEKYDEAIKYLKTDKNNDGISDYFIIVSCGSGLFTTGGHYIVLIGFNGKILVYDPSLYNGKFDTSSRKAARVVVSGNTAYVTETAFKNMSNYKRFFIYSNDHVDTKTEKPTTSTKPTSTTTENVKYTRYVATQNSNLNVRKGAGTSYGIITTLKKGTEVTVTKTNGSWSYIISPATGWVSSSYLSSSKVTAVTKVKYTRYVATQNDNLNVRSGPGINYNIIGSLKRGTSVNATKTSGSWTYIVYPIKGWVSTQYLSSTKVTTSKTEIKYKTTIDSYYTLQNDTILCSNGAFTGTKYHYLKNTKLKTVSHYSSTVDKVYVVKLGIYRYVKVKDLK